MTTEATNKLQGLSAALNPAMLSSGSATTTEDTSLFNNTFTQQLQQLQSDLTQIATLNPHSLASSTINTPLTADAETMLQNFAAVFGNQLPSAKNMDQSINLDETLDTLSNVLQRLQSLESTSNPVDLPPQTALQGFDVNEPIMAASELPEQTGLSSEMLLASESPEQAELSSEITVASDYLDGAVSNSVDANLGGAKTQLTPEPLLLGSAKQPASEMVDVATEMIQSSGLNPAFDGDEGKTLEEAKPLKEKPSLKMTIANQADSFMAAIPMIVSVGEEWSGVQLPAEQALDSSSVESNESLAQERLMSPVGIKTPSQDHGAAPLSQISLQSSSPMTNSFEQNFNVLLGLDSPADTKAILESAPTVVNDKNILMPFSENATQSSEAGVEKSVFSLSGDLQKLNQSLSSQSSSPTTSMLKTMNDPAWQTELGDKLIWMHKQSVPSVELRLNPEHLGPVLIKIDVQNDQASVSFSAQHQGVKEAIEASIPKLREMLGGQQLQLADVNVSQHQSEQRQGRDFYQAGEQGRNRQAQNDEAAPQNVTNDGQDIMEEIEAGRAIATNGLLSLFA